MLTGFNELKQKETTLTMANYFLWLGIVHSLPCEWQRMMKTGNISSDFLGCPFRIKSVGKLKSNIKTLMINDHTYQGETHISSYCNISLFFKLFVWVKTELLQFDRARYKNFLLCWSVELMILFSLICIFLKNVKRKDQK